MAEIQVCFSPALFPFQKNANANVVVVDILRATTSICEAFKNGVKSIIPVETVEEAREFKNKGYVVAAERDGLVLDFADFGNSPDNFSTEQVGGRDIAYSTTNGTRTIHIAAECKNAVIGAFINLTAVCDWLKRDGDDVIVLCAGWKNRFNIEDSLYAGAIVDDLLGSGVFETDCDSAKVAQLIWAERKDNLLPYVETSAQKKRLQKNGLDGCIPYSLTLDQTSVVPIFNGKCLVADKK